ncbi:MAG: hypothetical protein LBT01_06810 [Spirochaetaceae bacterium]|jgi:hypothetical protein|nr:hypothetical protein [Spirochaetaceae bacterium]
MHNMKEKHEMSNMDKILMNLKKYQEVDSGLNMMKYQDNMFEEEPKLIATLVKYKKQLLKELIAQGRRRVSSRHEEQRRLLAEAVKRKKAREADQYADETLAEVAGKRKQHLAACRSSSGKHLDSVKDTGQNRGICSSFCTWSTRFSLWSALFCRVRGKEHDRSAGALALVPRT